MVDGRLAGLGTVGLSSTTGGWPWIAPGILVDSPAAYLSLLLDYVIIDLDLHCLLSGVTKQVKTFEKLHVLEGWALFPFRILLCKAHS